MKPCAKCGETKLPDQYDRITRRGKKVLHSYCKQCLREWKRKWRAENPEKAKAQQAEYRRRRLERNPRFWKGASLKRNYGITLEEYDAMVEAQEGRCALCGTIPPPDDRWGLVVDHDHRTKDVRGLLCNTCNRGLGLLQDDPLLLQKAIAYLQPIPDDHPK